MCVVPDIARALQAEISVKQRFIKVGFSPGYSTMARLRGDLAEDLI